MKFLVFCIVIIANISHDGKAAREGYEPSDYHNPEFQSSRLKLLYDQKKAAELGPSPVSCHRQCNLQSEPRRCVYKFLIKPGIISDGKEALTINGITPGPPIIVCVNDVVVVEVENRIPGQDIAIHWNGVEHIETPFMDGVPMITQCPIHYALTFRYTFIANKPGTFFYHADSVQQQSDGIYGSLIVNQARQNDPHSALYDYDRSLDNTLIIGVRFLKLLTGNLADNSQKKPTHLLINGDQDLTKIFVVPGFAYKLRLINAIGLECPVRLHIEKHVMTVIATDGNPVKPASAKTVVLYPGERMDVVVSASQVKGGYWVKVDSTSGICAGLKAGAMFLYSGFEFPDLTLARQISHHTENMTTHVLSGQKLESLHEMTFMPAKKTAYLGIDKNLVRINASEVDFQYIIGALKGKPFFPAALLTLKETGLPQINDKNFLYPNFPMLLYPQEIGASVTCEVGKEKRVQQTQCVQLLDAKNGEWIELSLVNEGFGSDESFTFHMHGHSMLVLESWSKTDGTPITRKEFMKNHFVKHNDHNNNKRLLKHPVLKDTVSVPNKGYVIVRIKVHPGSWLLECRACSLLLPTAIVIHVPLTLPKRVFSALPKCGTFKPPDILLN